MNNNGREGKINMSVQDDILGEFHEEKRAMR